MQDLTGVGYLVTPPPTTTFALAEFQLLCGTGDRNANDFTDSAQLG